MKPTSTLSLYIFISLASAAPLIPGRELCHGQCKSSFKPFITSFLSVSYSKHTTSENDAHLPKDQPLINLALGAPSNSVPLPISPTLEVEVPLESSYLLNLPKSKDEKILASSLADSWTATDISEIEDLSPPINTLPKTEDGKTLESTVHHPNKSEKIIKPSKHPKVSSEMLNQEKRLKSIRRKLQKALLDSAPSAVPSEEINSYFDQLEKLFATAHVSSIRKSKIKKILLRIAKNEERTDEKYHFTGRARTLLGAYDRMVGVQNRKEAVHGDVLVVGIVLLFVLAVVIVEVADLIHTSIKCLLGFNEGTIRLQPQDNNLVSKLRPFNLRAPPKGQKKTLEMICEEV